jgi:hypothetical protein
VVLAAEKKNQLRADKDVHSLRLCWAGAGCLQRALLQECAQTPPGKSARNVMEGVAVGQRSLPPGSLKSREREKAKRLQFVNAGRAQPTWANPSG